LKNSKLSLAVFFAITHIEIDEFSLILLCLTILSLQHTLQNSYQIRFATTDDLEQILAIYNHEILTGTANWNDQAVALAQYQQRFQDMQQQQFPMIVVEDQSLIKIAGYAYYSAFRSITGYRQSIEHSVFIDPNYARQGLGKALMQQLIHLAILNSICISWWLRLIVKIWVQSYYINNLVLSNRLYATSRTKIWTMA
jgi:L-amino acid N-acyltransferase YncA